MGHRKKLAGLVNGGFGISCHGHRYVNSGALGDLQTAVSCEGALVSADGNYVIDEWG